MAERLPIPIPPLLPLVNPEKHLEKIVQYYVHRLRGLSINDHYRSHQRADELVGEFLWEIGYGEVADAYRSTKIDAGFSY